MEFGHKDDTIYIRHALETKETVTISARQVRQERTGIHARVEIFVDRAMLSWSLLNIERDEDRVRLSNSAYTHMNGLKEVFPKEHLKHDLDLFCAGLWDEAIRVQMPEPLAGTATPMLPDYRVTPYIVRGGGTILFAPPGRGKSYVTQLMAICVDTGNSTFFPVKQGNVLFINLERSKSSVANRIGNVNQVLGLPRTRGLLTMNARGRSVLDILPTIRRTVREKRIDCIFLDSISRAGFGDLTENKPVNQIADALNSLQVEWFAIAHTPRQDETHAYGSVFFEAASDIMLSMASQQLENGTLGLGIQISKQNDTGPQPMQVLALDFEPWGLSAVRTSSLKEFPEIANKKRSNREEIFDYLMDVGEATATQVANETGFNRSNVAQLLNHDPAFVKTTRRGVQQFYAVKYER